MLKPDLLEEARAWPRKEWSVTWPSEGQLQLDAMVGDHPKWGNQIWITFNPPAHPKLSFREWSADGQAAWYFTNVEGQSWISSDGTDLGTPNGPDLAIHYEGVGDIAGSPNRCGAWVYLTSEQLLRK